jgi:hypothetical protein
MRIELARPDLLYLLALLPLWALLLWPRVGRGFRFTRGALPARRPAPSARTAIV